MIDCKNRRRSAILIFNVVYWYIYLKAEIENYNINVLGIQLSGESSKIYTTDTTRINNQNPIFIFGIIAKNT